MDLSVLSEREGEKLSSARLTEIIRGLSDNAQVYLCGPEGLKSLVTTVWTTLGKTGRVYSERFDFRGAYGLTDLIYVGKPALDAARNWVTGRKDMANAAAGT